MLIYLLHNNFRIILNCHMVTHSLYEIYEQYFLFYIWQLYLYKHITPVIFLCTKSTIVAYSCKNYIFSELKFVYSSNVELCITESALMVWYNFYHKIYNESSLTSYNTHDFHKVFMMKLSNISFCLHTYLTHFNTTSLLKTLHFINHIFWFIIMETFLSIKSLM